ncbi:hypothetical protein PR048_011846 [Dryococelus australis]|uniref:Uncharacterized protein n=1 Tax=Dryococelus australis TaxID=614101 RepID=A0ABQ9HMS6_9NEOP|nr:hypothetical protein PR048_011846 [Dryococelus australis]
MIAVGTLAILRLGRQHTWLCCSDSRRHFASQRDVQNECYRAGMLELEICFKDGLVSSLLLIESNVIMGKLDKMIDEQQTVREKIFHHYMALGDRDKNVNYVVSLVNSKATAVTRKRIVDPGKKNSVIGERFSVCRGCFMKTLDDCQMFVTFALIKQNGNVTGISGDAKRRKTPPSKIYTPEKLQDIKDHTSSFPRYMSHYTHRESTIIPELAREYTKEELYKMNLIFKEPKRCIIRRQTKQTLKKSKARNLYIPLKTNRCYVIHLTYSYFFDTILNTSVCFYNMSLWVYNLTIHETSTGNRVHVVEIRLQHVFANNQ